MAHGIFNPARDFQIAEQMAWHKLTRIAKPTIDHFPEIKPLPLYYNGGKDMVYGNRKFVVPVATDDMLPVAPPYCGETIVDESEKGCEEKDKRGTYILFTPREAWNWVNEVLAGTQYNVDSIGMLWNRSFWFISTKLTELQSLSCGDGRKTDFQLNFSGGLDRSVSPQCELSGIVAVCHNTISLSRASGKILFHERATKGFTERLDLAKNEVAKAVGMSAVFKAAMDTLAQNPCDGERAEKIFAGVVTPADAEKMSARGKNTVKTLTFLHSNGIANKGETEFDLLNAYTQLLTHGADDAKTSLGRRFASSEFGNNADSKSWFYNLLTDPEMEAEFDEIEARGEKLLAVANGRLAEKAAVVAFETGGQAAGSSQYEAVRR